MQQMAYFFALGGYSENISTHVSLPSDAENLFYSFPKNSSFGENFFECTFISKVSDLSRKLLPL